jgi:hypothetical protein
MSISISRACERFFGGYEIGTCLIFTSLFANGFYSMPNFLFFVGIVSSSLVVMFALFSLGRMIGWIVPKSASLAASSPQENGLTPERLPNEA